MILLDVKNYIQQHEAVNREALQNHFDLDSHALDGLLMPLVAQGHVIETATQASTEGKLCASGHCGDHCQLPDPKRILWCEKPLKPLPIAIQIN